MKWIPLDILWFSRCFDRCCFKHIINISWNGYFLIPCDFHYVVVVIVLTYCWYSTHIPPHSAVISVSAHDFRRFESDFWCFSEVITEKILWKTLNRSWALVHSGVHPSEFVFHRNHSQSLVISGIQTHSGELSSARAPMMDSLCPPWDPFIIYPIFNGSGILFHIEAAICSVVSVITPKVLVTKVLDCLFWILAHAFVMDRSLDTRWGHNK